MPEQVRHIRHICMAEDDPDDFYFFSNVLQEVNNSVKLTWLQTCEGLLDFLKTAMDLPDIIVLDMNMPKMGGQACLATIKKNLSLHHIPVIIFSTASTPLAIELAYQEGAIRYIIKPSSLEGLRKVVSEILSIPLV